MHLLKLLFALSFTLVSLTAQATPALILDLDDRLAGVSNIQVNDQAYDVEFKFGFCSTIFSGCDNISDLTFSSKESAEAASTALGKVLLDFDGKVKWENYTSSKFLLTPYEILPNYYADQGEDSGFVKGVGTIYEGIGYGNIYDIPHFNSVQNFDTIWAKWQVSQVPESNTLLLFALALLTLTIKRKLNNVQLRHHR